MKKILFLVLLAGFWGHGIIIEKIITATDVTSNGNTYDIDGITDDFAVDQKMLNVVVKYKGAALGEIVVSKWIAVDAVPERPNYLIASVENKLDLDHGAIRAKLEKGKNNWPKGHYRMELYIKDKKISQKEFTIGLGTKNTSSVNGSGSTQDARSGEITDLILAEKISIDKKGFINYSGKSDIFEDTVHRLNVIVGYKDLKTPGQIVFRWYLDKSGDNNGEFISERTVDIELASGAVTSYIELADSPKWPAGKYHIEIWYKGRKFGTKVFSITSSSSDNMDNKSTHSAIVDKLVASKWIDKSGDKISSISFPSFSKFNYDGNIMPCSIDDTSIKVHGSNGWFTLYYRIENDKLYLTINNNTAVYQRDNQSTSAATAPQQGNKEPKTLFGDKYCSTKNSGNEWIKLGSDNKFSFGLLSSDKATASGRYRVEGDIISIYIGKEDAVTMKIVRRDNKGYVNTMDFDGTIYDINLCR